jgi:DNA-binding response OmpR family regulator
MPIYANAGIRTLTNVLENTQMAPFKILLVEDDPMLRRLCGKMLEVNGYSVLTAEDGLEGLSKAQKEKPDIIILDVMLPKMDGYKVSRILKSDARTKTIPIILHTARMEEKPDVILGETGADAFVVKNSNLNELLNTVGKYAKVGNIQ